ncbi:proteasome maturation factor Ump1p [Trichomonascus vanleenenianus]|uniref:Ump1p n=1 Tax=Trichomonascus vanleenenianus TaxID=2268995 RepID=UPI003ECAE4E7
MSLKFIPTSDGLTEVSATSFGSGAPSVMGLHDSIRNDGNVSIASKLNNRHPLEKRLEQWDETQADLKMSIMRRTYGAAEPIRRAMEKEIVRATSGVPKSLQCGSQIHKDILENRETTVDWEDVYPGTVSTLSNVDIHSEMSKQMGI